MKNLSVIFLVFVVLGAYWNFHVYQKKHRLAIIAKPFQEACQTESGCANCPTDWSKERDGCYTKVDGQFMTYIAGKTEFMIDWHIATDVHLIAKGGKAQEMAINRVME